MNGSIKSMSKGTLELTVDLGGDAKGKRLRGVGDIRSGEKHAIKCGLAVHGLHPARDP